MKKMGILLFVILCLISYLGNTVSPVQASEQERYGYTLLTTDTQRTAYKAIAAGIAEAKAQISFTISGITQDNSSTVSAEVQYAQEMVAKDYPEYFWYTGGYGISVSGNTITLKPNGYSVAGETVMAGSAKLNQAQSQLEQAISAALSVIPRNPSDYEIAHALHDYLVDHVEYLQAGDHQTAYGALVSGQAVCAGYAKAYQLLMNKAGIRCTYVCGESYDPMGNKIPHAWNLVWLDGKCYYTDVTWDDQGTELFHEFLNMSREEIEKTHFADPMEVLPSDCGHDDYRFFVKNSGKGVCDIRNAMSDADVAECFELKSRDGDQAVYYCTIHYHADDFGVWLQEHHSPIADLLGYDSYKLNYIELGHEHHIVYTGQLRSSEPEPSQSPTTTLPSAATQPSVSTRPTDTTAPTLQPTESTSPTLAPTEPIAPTNPTEPTDPTQPTEPTDPTQPTQETTQTTPPTEPTAPLDPIAPTHSTSDTSPESTQSTDSSEPTAPSQTEFTEGTDPEPTQSTAAPTAPIEKSDPDNQISWILIAAAVLVISAAVAGLVVFFVKRNKKV